MLKSYRCEELSAVQDIQTFVSLGEKFTSPLTVQMSSSSGHFMGAKAGIGGTYGATELLKLNQLNADKPIARELQALSTRYHCTIQICGVISSVPGKSTGLNIGSVRSPHNRPATIVQLVAFDSRTERFIRTARTKLSKESPT